jgi:hypothetical protein
MSIHWFSMSLNQFRYFFNIVLLIFIKILFVLDTIRSKFFCILTLIILYWWICSKLVLIITYLNFCLWTIIDVLIRRLHKIIIMIKQWSMNLFIKFFMPYYSFLIIITPQSSLRFICCLYTRLRPRILFLKIQDNIFIIFFI